MSVTSSSSEHEHASVSRPDATSLAGEQDSLEMHTCTIRLAQGCVSESEGATGAGIIGHPRETDWGSQPALRVGIDSSHKGDQHE